MVEGRTLAPSRSRQNLGEPHAERRLQERMDASMRQKGKTGEQEELKIKYLSSAKQTDEMK